MTVSITIFDLEQPQGELDESLFPGCDFEDLLQGWLDQAASKVEAETNIALTDQDAAAAAWVYYRAFTRVADRFANSPSTIMIDGTVTRTTAVDQRKYFADKAASWLARYYEFGTTSQLPGVPAFFGTVKARRNAYSI